MLQKFISSVVQKIQFDSRTWKFCKLYSHTMIFLARSSSPGSDSHEFTHKSMHKVLVGTLLAIDSLEIQDGMIVSHALYRKLNIILGIKCEN